MKINTKCLSGKGKKAILKKEGVGERIFTGRKRIFQEEEWESYKCDRSNLHKITQVKTAYLPCKRVQDQTQKSSKKEKKPVEY